MKLRTSYTGRVMYRLQAANIQVGLFNENANLNLVKCQKAGQFSDEKSHFIIVGELLRWVHYYPQSIGRTAAFDRGKWFFSKEEI